MELTCISCPLGCRIQVVMQQNEITEVLGNRCKRGDIYARQECVDPKRIITAVIPVAGSKIPLSVKTSTPISKKKIKDCIKALAAVKLTAPIAAGTVILSNVCETGVDVVATRSV